MQKAPMGDGNVSKVVFVSGSKSTNFVSKNRPRIRTWFIVIVVVVLFFGAVVLSAMLMTKTKEKTNSSRSVTEVNLEEGEILTYRVEQRLEIRGGDVQKGTIIADVVILVLNKTSDEYWLLMKINTTVEGDSVGNMGGVRPGIMDYFLVKLKVASSLESTNASNVTDAFELYGHQETDGDFIRYVYSIVNQLLPAVKRDLYEDVDGEKVSPGRELSPEKSLLCPGAVRMHRKANTSDENEVLIKNNFNRSDLVNVSSEIDLDITYSDLMFINKSNGMVTESRAYMSEQLNFGEPIHSKSGSDVTTMNITLLSNIVLTEANPRAGGYYTHEEFAAVGIDAFVKLLLAHSDGHFVINEKQVEVASDCSNASGSFINESHCSKNSTTASHSPIKRTRRGRFARHGWKGLNRQTIPGKINKSPTLFKKKMIGINVNGETDVWLSPKHRHSFELGVGFSLRFGSLSVQPFQNRFDDKQIKRGLEIRIRRTWETELGIGVSVYFLTLGVEFSLWISVDITLRFPSFNPENFAVEIEPSIAVTTSLAGYVSVYVLRGGVYGDGTLVKGGLPVTLSYREHRHTGRKWCLDLSARVTALELEAGIFYQWISCRWKWFWLSCGWGDRHTLYRFGKWAAFRYNWKLFETCF